LTNDELPAAWESLAYDLPMEPMKWCLGADVLSAAWIATELMSFDSNSWA
jgi:hypothetical protein